MFISFFRLLLLVINMWAVADRLPRLGNSAIVYNCVRFPLPLGAWDRLRYFIVALPGPSK